MGGSSQKQSPDQAKISEQQQLLQQQADMERKKQESLRIAFAKSRLSGISAGIQNQNQSNSTL